MNNHDDSGWQSPSDDSADRESPRPRDDAPRFGAYGSPPPGRDLIVPPSTTFEQLGLAIDRALGRWDLAHLREFTLADGTRITDEETRRMLHSGGFGEGILVERTADLGERVKKHVSVDDVFRYVFDLSDEWTCRCTMTGFGDPESLYGVVVSQPVPIWGWGRLPDQYGRDRRDSDEQPDASLSTQQKRAIRKETTAFVMDFGHMDPERLDPKDLRTARAAGDIGALLAALAGVETGHVLQQVGQAFAEVWEHGAGPVKRRGRRGVERELESATMGLSNALSWRDRAGDAQLAHFVFNAAHCVRIADVVSLNIRLGKERIVER